MTEGLLSKYVNLRLNKSNLKRLIGQQLLSIYVLSVTFVKYALMPIIRLIVMGSID